MSHRLFIYNFIVGIICVIIFLKLTDKRKTKAENININELKKKLTSQKKNELFNLYSKSHLSKLKNKSLIEYK